MTVNENQRPACFGILEKVFPAGKHGLRETPEDCMACSHKTACLKTVLEGADGLKVQEEFLDRAYASGKISFWERWSRKKGLKHQAALKTKGKT